MTQSVSQMGLKCTSDRMMRLVISSCPMKPEYKLLHRSVESLNPTSGEIKRKGAASTRCAAHDGNLILDKAHRCAQLGRKLELAPFELCIRFEGKLCYAHESRPRSFDPICHPIQTEYCNSKTVTTVSLN